jgi:hypothetical protein
MASRSTDQALYLSDNSAHFGKSDLPDVRGALLTAALLLSDDRNQDVGKQGEAQADCDERSGLSQEVTERISSWLLLDGCM